jgi:peptidoglycan pentaglycine glycine transferase (the first glycine)
MTSRTDAPAGDPEAPLVCRTSAWDEFLVSHHAAGFMQSSWWADVMFTMGWGHFGVVLKDGDSIAGGAQVYTSQVESAPPHFYVPEGPVLPRDETDAAEIFQAVMDFINQKRHDDGARVSHLNIEPRWEKFPEFVTGFRRLSRWSEPRNTLYIDLTASEGAMLARMKPKGRYNIKLARRHGVSVVEDISPEGLQDFLRLYRATIERHKLKKWLSTTMLEALLRKFNNIGCGSIFFAEYKGERIAAAVVIYFGKRATYYAGGSLETHREVMAPYLLHFHVMLRAKELGHRWYDLYGIAPTSEANHKWAGFSAFKRKLGGVDVNFVPSMDYVYDLAAYEKSR